MPTLLLRLRAELQRVANPQKAPQMQAYMKSAMPYHGVPTPLSRPLFRELFKDIQFANAQEWRRAVLELWHQAEFREERYAALHLTDHPTAQKFQSPAAMQLYEELIVTGAWWDYVDDIAAHKVGLILKKHPRVMKPKLRRWSKSPDLWKRRTAIISQLSFKKETDLEFLYACIEPSLDSKEFFLRKAIGWALRQYAWTDPKEVARYVQKNAHRLSGLSQREALKNIRRKNKRGEITANPARYPPRVHGVRERRRK